MTAATFTPATALDSNTTYYWQVVAINNCGDALPSAKFSFTTEVAFCRSSALAIRDNNAAGVSDNLSIGTTGTLPRLRLWLDVTHTQIGDLTLSLSKGTTSVIVLQRPGNASDTGDSGCSGDNIKVLVDDVATKTPGNPLRRRPGAGLSLRRRVQAQQAAGRLRRRGTVGASGP